MQSLCLNRLPLATTRREFLQRTGMSLGALALGTMVTDEARAAGALAARQPPLPCKAKRVIHIFAGGAPSQIDTFDSKPTLEKFRGQTASGFGGVLWPSPFAFHRSGQSGLEISELFPHLQKVADEMCLVRSLHSEIPAHGPAYKYMNTGSAVLTRPSLGSWLLYGLGTENQNLPGFVALGGDPEARQSAFLPSLYQGAKTEFKAGATVDRVLSNLRSEFSSLDQQRAQLDYVRQINERHLQNVQRDEQLEARIESFELAFQMQSAATDAFDVSREPAQVREAYGKGDLAAKLLCARRLVERGVRFVQVDASGWDHHGNLATAIKKTALAVDQPAAALISDLKQKGLLDETLVLWGGEFGRPPNTSGRISAESGRDHWSKVYCCWMAGGGVKPGISYGESDELGAEPARDPVHLHDLHATILRLLGFDHTQLTYRHNGRDFRLTDNFGKIVNGIIA
ncbi:MAG: hypothetical protein RLZZ399_1446 [Verrucomicrobiota bacterium]